MTKTTKTTQTNKAAETRAAAEKVITEKRKAVRGTALYGKIKGAVDKAIEEAASEGASGIVFPEAKIPGELGSPDVPVAKALVECENPVLVTETLVEDLESEGYKVLRLLGVPVAVAWPKPDAE
jgi:hypothetical protein